MNNLNEIVDDLYQKTVQIYNDNPNMLFREAFEKNTVQYTHDQVEELWGLMVDIMNRQFNPSGELGNYELTDFEKEINRLYEEFISSKSIASLESSIKRLKQKIDYFKENSSEENLVMPIRDYESLNIELNDLEYGLQNWIDIRRFIENTSNKQVDIQKGLNLEKHRLSTFFYMMDKLGFVKKEKIKNRVYVKIIVH